jgi:hypothetical protein
MEARRVEVGIGVVGSFRDRAGSGGFATGVRVAAVTRSSGEPVALVPCGDGSNGEIVAPVGDAVAVGDKGFAVDPQAGERL